MWSAVGAPDERQILDVLPLKRPEVWSIVFHFALEHGHDAVSASVLCVWGANADVEGGGGMPQGSGEDVGGSQPGAGDETHDLVLRRGVALLCGAEDHAFYRVVPFGGLGDGATGRVRARRVKELSAAPGARNWVGGTSSAQSNTNGLNELVLGEDWPVVLGHVPKPRVVDPRVLKLL
jgi:hypothetical protein